MSFFISGSNSRANYKIAKEVVTRAGLSPEAAKLTDSYVRFEALINTTSSAYQFGVLVNQPSPGAATGTFNTEVKLNLQDSFIANEVGVFLALPSSATDDTFKLASYASQQQFTTGYAQLNKIYNGSLSLGIDNKTIVPKFDVFRSLFIPQTQQIAATGATAAQQQMDGNSYGMTPIQPMWIFNGKQNIQFTLNLATAITTVDANTRVVVLLRGHLAQNVGINQQY